MGPGSPHGWPGATSWGVPQIRPRGHHFTDCIARTPGACTAGETAGPSRPPWEQQTRDSPWQRADVHTDGLEKGGGEIETDDGVAAYSSCLKFQQLKSAEILCAGPFATPVAKCNPTLPVCPNGSTHLLALLSLPQYSLSTVFVVSFISATLLPLGSEPVVFGLVQLNPDQFWPVVWWQRQGNTLGGAVDWWMGYGAHQVVDKYRHSQPIPRHWTGWRN
jgi:hypothetical protein